MATTPATPNNYSGTNLWAIATNASHIRGISGEIQLREFWQTVGEMNPWTPHIGAGMDNVIQLNTDFTKEKGDIVHFYLSEADTGAPADNAKETWGQEESTKVHQDSVIVDMVTHAKRLRRPLDIQRSVFNVIETLRQYQEQWWTQYGIGKWITRKLSGLSYFDGASTPVAIGEAAVANTNVMYGGDATGTGDIDDSDKLTLELAYKAKEGARLGVIGSSTKRILHPCTLMTGGMGFKLFLGPRSVYDLTHDPDWKDTWKMDIRGQNTMLIKGEGNLPGTMASPFARIDDMELYLLPGIITATTWGVNGDVHGEINLFCGAQAGLLARCQGPNWEQEGGFYRQYIGVMVEVLMGFDKAQFMPAADDLAAPDTTAIDNGVIALKVAAKNHYTNS